MECYAQGLVEMGGIHEPCFMWPGNEARGLEPGNEAGDWSLGMRLGTGAWE